jgi:hypothetical protein
VGPVAVGGIAVVGVAMTSGGDVELAASVSVGSGVFVIVAVGMARAVCVYPI